MFSNTIQKIAHVKSSDTSATKVTGTGNMSPRMGLFHDLGIENGINHSDFGTENKIR